MKEGRKAWPRGARICHPGLGGDTGLPSTLAAFQGGKLSPCLERAHPTAGTKDPLSWWAACVIPACTGAGNGASSTTPPPPPGSAKDCSGVDLFEGFFLFFLKQGSQGAGTASWFNLRAVVQPCTAALH